MEVKVLRQIIGRYDDENSLSPDQLENMLNELRDVAQDLEELPDLSALTNIVTAVDERLTKIEDTVDLVAKHAEPIIAEVMNSPMFRMLTGGKR